MKTETSVLSGDLAPGDELIATGIGGHVGTITAVRVFADYTRVDLDAGYSAFLDPLEVCTVKRERLASVHPIFAGVLSAARHMGR